MRLSVGLLLAVLIAPAVMAAGASEPEPFGAVDQWVLDRMAEARIPGAAVALVRDGAIVHARGYGEADGTGRAPTPQTPFFVMSITKSFTATLVLQLVEEGKLELDAPVVQYLPWFEVSGPGSDEISIRHLLTHTSGLPSLLPGEYERILAAPATDDLEREVRLLGEITLHSPPGTRFQYSNVGYSTLALLIETVEGKPYEDVLEERLFGPLGMDHSHARKADAEADGLAAGHRSWFGRAVAYDWDYSRIGLGAGFTYAGAEDLARFGALHLEGGELDGVRLLNPETVAAMHDPAVEIPSPYGDRHYGMGWFVSEHHGSTMVHHSGAGPNYRSDLLLLPEQGWGIAVLVNKNDVLDQGPIESIGPGIASILLGEEPVVEQAGGAFGSARTALIVIDLLLVGLVVRSLLRLRRPPRPGRSVRRVLGLVAGLAWAGLTLRVLPDMFWPLVGLRLEAPDLALLLTTSGVLGLVLAGLTVVHMVRSVRTGAGKTVTV